MKAAAHEHGIAPIEKSHHDFNRILSGIPEDEARVMRRKFRKLWRRYLKKSITKRGHRYRDTALGLGCKNPTRTQKNNRKNAVVAQLFVDTVGPLHKKISDANT